MLESLDSTILFGFTEEAQSYLPEIRLAVSPEATAEDLQLAFRHTHTIKGAALMVGLPDLSELAGTVEAVLEVCLNEETIPDETTANQLAFDVDRLEIMLGEIVTALVAETNEQIVNSFGDVAAYYHENASEFDFASRSVSEEFDDEEIDSEMLEVFAEEAADLLQNIGENLKALEQNLQNQSALGEIRRSSHTLKGAAAVCGIRSVSRIAHRLEDLLDSLAENPSASNLETNALILSTTDLLERLTQGASESSLKTETERLFQRFDNALSKQAPKIETQIPFPTKSYEQEREKSNRIESESHHFASPETMPPTPSSNNSRVEDEAGNEETTTAAVHPANLRKTVVRVGLDRLDEMVKLIGEMVISRNALEQRLAQVESQLAEMNRNTRRLKRISGKLETDYEINTFSGAGNDSANNFPPNGFPASPSASNSADETKHGFDALEFDRYTEFHQLTRELSETASDASGIKSELDDLVGNLETILSRQRRTTEEMQEKLMRLRMVPLNTLYSRLERTVRVTAEQEDKLADFRLEGEDLELDTQVLDSLTEPLLHLLRNSIAHGIESPEERALLGKPERGSIRLAVIHEGTHVIFTITDDGRGLDLAGLRKKAVENHFINYEKAAALDDDETAQLVFLPGLSTAKEVSEVSGRGVGMDAVRESVERQQGSISIKSKPDAGTTVTIRLPMSLAVTRALLVKTSGSTFAVPVGMIRQLTEIGAEDFEETAAGKVLNFDGIVHQHYSLNALLDLPEIVERDSALIPTIVLNSNENQIALTFDQTLDAREIVIKPFDALLRRVRGLLGATVLGDGTVIPILDLFELINRSRKQTAVKEVAKVIATQPTPERLNVLIVDDSTSVRRVMTNLITKSGWHAIAAKDGIEALEMLQKARHLPNVILSDVEMPRMDGYEFVATLGQQNVLREIPVVMITSRGGEKHRRKALEMGVAEYITKPYQDTILIETIKRLCSQN
jgi:chemosensory pili system protein ChpA (sensor histidine kinase/response regulator)